MKNRWNHNEKSRWVLYLLKNWKTGNIMLFPQKALKAQQTPFHPTKGGIPTKQSFTFPPKPECKHPEIQNENRWRPSNQKTKKKKNLPTKKTPEACRHKCLHPNLRNAHARARVHARSRIKTSFKNTLRTYNRHHRDRQNLWKTGCPHWNCNEKSVFSLWINLWITCG